LDPSWFNPGSNTLTVEVNDNYEDREGGIWCICLCLERKPICLGVSGTLRWSDMPPGESASATLVVSNIGDEDSNLNWKIAEYPSWGTWTFNPDSGVNLKPEDGPVEVEVEVEYPEEKNTEFSGEVKIVNLDNPEEYEIITVSLTTLKNKAINIPLFLQKIIQRYPILEKILNQII
jgi:hypothetical protein